MSINYYITYNEFNRGVYKSQVIETLKMYGTLGKQFKLIALLPLKRYFSNRKWVKESYPNSLILPAIPGLCLLYLNLYAFFLIESNSNIICRGSIATNLALKLKRKFRKIIYDARSAIAEEHREYGNGRKYKRLSVIERNAIFLADYKLSVSRELINYWKQKFKYEGDDFLVIPCCVAVDSQCHPHILDVFFDNIVIVFSGSTHPWQSFPLNCSFIDQVLSIYDNVNILFLTKENDEINQLKLKHGTSRIQNIWVKENEVNKYLALCDYGLMLREDNITNNVSAPVKFAEYLINGLNIITSPSVKDYSLFVEDFACGYIWESGMPIPLLVKNTNKIINQQLAEKYFTRYGECNIKKIKELLSLL
ncbi:glycosyltransferase family 4 protein [Citrobacter sedlakii]|nr:glycosyltransferase family 4 protein [Citrobacter sedlakii]